MNQTLFEIHYTFGTDNTILLGTNLTREEALSRVEREFEQGKLTGQTYQKKSMHRWEHRTMAKGLHSVVEIVAIK